MKKLLLGVGVIMLVFNSCTDSKKTDTSTTTVSGAETNSMHSKEIYRAIETGDVSKVEFLDDDIIDHEGSPDGDVKGKDNVKAMLADIHNHISNLKMETIADATSADGQYHFALIRMSGTTTDDKMGMPANTAMDHSSVDVVKVKDGKAVEHWGFYEMKSMPGNKMENKMKSDDKMKMDTTKK